MGKYCAILFMSINPDLECAGSTAAPPSLDVIVPEGGSGGGEIGRRAGGGGGCGVSEKPCGVRAVRHVRHSAASGTIVGARGGGRKQKQKKK